MFFTNLKMTNCSSEFPIEFILDMSHDLETFIGVNQDLKSILRFVNLQFFFKGKN